MNDKVTEKPSHDPVYPFMGCPNSRKLLDPLEGCAVCNSVGYHRTVRNPEWETPPAGKRRWHEMEQDMTERNKELRDASCLDSGCHGTEHKPWCDHAVTE